MGDCQYSVLYKNYMKNLCNLPIDKKPAPASAGAAPNCKLFVNKLLNKKRGRNLIHPLELPIYNQSRHNCDYHYHKIISPINPYGSEYPKPRPSGYKSDTKYLKDDKDYSEKYGDNSEKINFNCSFTLHFYLPLFF